MTTTETRAGSNGATAEVRALLDSVRGRDGHDCIPCEVDQIAWMYLAPEKRMRRWTETIEIFDLGSSRRKITIDFSLPKGEKKQRWMLPTAYFGKWPVAPDLEVRDAAGSAVSVPTKEENMAMTYRALEGLGAAGLIPFHDEELRDLCHQVIFDADVANLPARVARLLVEERLSPEDHLLRSLLRALEDQFLLWVPVTGEPGCDQQISIHRRQDLARNEIRVRARVFEERTVKIPTGTAKVDLLAATGRRRLSVEAALSRWFLRPFGLTPFEYEHESTEAHRFASFHLQVLAPEGMVVRDAGLRVLPDDVEQHPQRVEAPPSRPGLAYRGRENNIAHFHCARPENPAAISAFATIGVRGGLTSLWAGAVVFTALLLWAIHRLAPADLPTAVGGPLEATVAVLLIGPALASAWAIRADSGDVLESTLSGARACLLTSALLSVAVALSLAGFRPFHWSNETAIEIYASLSYGAASLIVIGWAVTLSACWILYREVLTTSRRNYAALAVAATFAASAGAHGDLPIRFIGLTLLAMGLFMATIAAHPGRPTGVSNTGPPIAAIGSLGTLLAAGWFLGFYENLGSRELLRFIVLGFECPLLLLAALQWYRTL